MIEQAVHCDLKPWAAWVFVRLLLHQRPTAGLAGCMVNPALASFISSFFLLEGRGRSQPRLLGGLRRPRLRLPRDLGFGEGACAHEGSPPLWSGGELGSWSWGALRPSSYVCACCQNGNWGTKTKAKVRGCWRRGRAGTVAKWAPSSHSLLKSTSSVALGEGRGCFGGAIPAAPAASGAAAADTAAGSDRPSRWHRSSRQLGRYETAAIGGNLGRGRGGGQSDIAMNSALGEPFQ